MSNRKPPKAVRIIQRFSRLFSTVTKALMTWVLRMALMGRRRRSATGGFVLPTTVLLVLVVSLTAGALSYRAYNSSTRAINETQNRVIYNAATPAVDRARAKLDYLFDDKKDDRLPNGVPSVDFLTSMLLNTATPAVINGTQVLSQKTLNGGGDPYTFPGETRVDINKDGKVDNAWYYRADTDGNGSEDATVVYSLIFSTPQQQTTLLTLADSAKANGDTVKAGDTQAVPFTRTGPLSGAKATGCGSSGGNTQSFKVEQGWYQDATNTSILRKNFQIDALVIPDGKGTPGTAAAVPTNLSTLEVQQDRQLSRGNKWGAWFRNDLEVFPGVQFNWNGAMHTEGSLMIGGGNFSAYLVSSPNSCLFYAGASEISVTKEPKTSDTQTSPFLGLVVGGSINNDGTDGSSNIHIHATTPPVATLDSGSDSTIAGKAPSAVALDPQELQTSNGYKAVDGSENTANLDTAGVDDAKQFLKRFDGRIRMNAEKPPYVDDGYRADNRYGPKKVYNATKSIPTGSKAGDAIPASEVELVGDAPIGADKGAVGLDGYWERRGRNEGLRILVGQRLELGNAAGWVAPQDRPNARPVAAYLSGTTVTAGDGNTDLRNKDYGAVTAASDFTSTDFAKRPDADTSDNEGDPLYPPTETLSHEARQRRALRDNLSAVQATAIYHAAVNKDTPLACMATTAHFGSPFAIQRSISFLPATFAGGELLVDFFNGRGTNGWEFALPSTFITDIQSSTSGLGIALRNLANFAGDPDGAFPPKQEAGKVHPDPYQTMWGNFSNLKRAISLMDSGGYAALSPADKTYLHTAACTVGMLAYNIQQLQAFDPTNVANDSTKVVQDLGIVLADLMNGDVNDGEVLSKGQLATYGYDPNSTADFDPARYNPRDYDRVPAEAFLGKVREYYVRNPQSKTGSTVPNAGDPTRDPRIQMAELISTSMQVRRDRTYGFRPSPAANTWNYNPYVTHSLGGVAPDKPLLWSSACDPNLFSLGTKSTGTQYAPYDDSVPGAARIIERQMLGLSRLCGTVVPSAAIHDFPGDLNYPARGNTANSANLLKRSDGTTLITATELELPDVPATPVFTGNSLKDEIGKSKPYGLAQVLPHWPSLYYLFPEFEHDQNGGVTAIPGTNPVVNVDHRQPGNTTDAVTGFAAFSTLPVALRPWDEPYITNVSVPSTVTYKPVQTIGSATGYAAAKTGPATPAILTFKSSIDDATQLPYNSFEGILPIDQPVSSAALLPGDKDVTRWVLPTLASVPASPPKQNTPPNRIVATDGTVAVVPFLDRVIFNGREGLPARVLDIDLGLLRRRSPANQNSSGTEVAPNDVWLPASGLVYAFREDAVREDAINRPASATPCSSTGKACTDARNPDPARQTDPGLTPEGISLKPVDFVPDPERRPHGFRLRNGTQLARHTSVVAGNFTKDENNRGMDFISDNPVYILGHYNLHQLNADSGKEDDGDPDDQARADRLEEFKQRLPTDRPYDFATFYTDRKDLDPNFANPDTDRWRPSAILADSISVLSNTFCDGSAIDGFMAAGGTAETASLSANAYKGATKTSEGRDIGATNGLYPYSNSGAGAYNDTTKGLFAPGCTDGGRSSFLNQNRPRTDTQLNAGWSWVRENPADIFSPIKISRNGNAFLLPPNRTVAATTNDEQAIAQKPPVLPDYSIGVGGNYFATNQNRPLQVAQDTRANSIFVGSIGPSRKNQSYGGMHNFPVFLEKWDGGRSLWFAGSFLQLSFSNSATAPYDLEVTEPTGSAPSNSSDTRPYYDPPNRFWGYDPALLLAPSGPIASRFVSTEITRSEFYSEVAANDPYISNLCNAVAGSVVQKLTCPK